MNAKSCRWWVRLAVGGLWVLALGTVFAPAQARASCGDGLVSLGSGHPAVRTDSPRQGADTDKPVRAPCSGPHCSRVPPAPAPLPDSPAPRRVDDSGTLPLLALPPASGAFAALADEPPTHPLRRASDVYHPPR